MPAHDLLISDESLSVTRPARGPIALALVCVAAALTATVLAGWLSEGVYHEDDLTHYLFARWANQDTRYLLDTWGRPGFTVPYSWVASIGSCQTGLQCCRLLSAVLSAATAWICFQTARRLGLRHAWLVIPLLYVQPLFTRLSLTTLTETPLAFYFAGATYLLLTRHHIASAAIMAIAPLTREEAIILLPIWAIALWKDGARWWCIPLMGWAIAAHNLASAACLGYWPVLRWLSPAGADFYGKGILVTFVARLMVASGPVVVALAVMGSLRLARGRVAQAGRASLNWLLVAAPLTYFLAETVIYMRGAFSSGGYARFLVPIAPWMAILATAGLRPLLARCERIRWQATCAVIAIIFLLWTCCELEWRYGPSLVQVNHRSWITIGRWAAGAIACTMIAMAAVSCAAGSTHRRRLATVLRCFMWVSLTTAGLSALRPLALRPNQQEARRVSQALAHLTAGEHRVLTLNRWVYYWSDLWTPWRMRHNDPNEALEDMQSGSLFVWDDRFCLEPWPHLTYAQMQARPGWQLAWTLLPSVDPQFAVFRRAPDSIR